MKLPVLSFNPIRIKTLNSVRHLCSIVMSQSNSAVDVTSGNPETYNSSHIAQFGWTENPIGSNGFLVVEFQSGDEYVYMGVPEDISDELEDRAKNPKEYGDSVGQYFNANIRKRFHRRGVDYQRMQH